MKEIVVLSGKGGTGKTSFTAAFARLASTELVLGDCDVDASNLGLLMPGRDTKEEPFFAGQRASVDRERCTGCGACIEVCRYEALSFKRNLFPEVDSLSCEGCRACSLVCSEEAISYVEHRSGTLYERECDTGPLVHAALGVAEDNSGKLVAKVRERTRTIAEAKGIGTVLLDGPPGIGCPVHAALTGVDLVVAVTEPTPSGVHDLTRLLDLCDHFGLSTEVIINKFDLNRDRRIELAAVTESRGATLAGAVPFSKDVPMALARGESPLAVPIVREALDRIWFHIESL